MAGHAATGIKLDDRETDPQRLKTRQKAIDYGKNTIGYDNYVRMVPKHKRSRGDPQTPDKYQKVSKRMFDGLIKSWRRKLHKWDGNSEGSGMIIQKKQGDGGGTSQQAPAPGAVATAPGAATQGGAASFKRLTDWDLV